MKKKNALIVLIAFACAVPPAAFCQAFTNLDFESASLTPVPAGQLGGIVSFASALPGWTGYYGDRQATVALQNSYTLGTAAHDILGPVAWNYNPFGPTSIDGKYAAMLQPGEAGSPTNVTTSISQLGTVPIDARSLTFKAHGTGFTVSLGGQGLAVLLLTQGPSYNVYGADVSTFAGQLEELRFTTALDFSGPGALTLDSISFSSTPVPEPSTFVIGSLALAALVLRVHLNRRQKCNARDHETQEREQIRSSSLKTGRSP